MNFAFIRIEYYDNNVKKDFCFMILNLNAGPEGKQC